MLCVSHSSVFLTPEAGSGVPKVGIPLFGNQHENLLRVKAKKFGVSIQLKQIKAETLALKSVS